MNIIHKVTWNCMKQNKKRTIVTILGVIICVAMISAICVIAFSFQASMVAYSEIRYGTYEARLNDLNQQQCLDIYQEPALKDRARLGFVGYVIQKDISKEMSNTLLSSDLDHLELYGASLIDGTLPSNSHELLVPKELMEHKNFPYHINDSISFDIGFYETEEEEHVFHKEKQQTFKISGVIDYGRGDLSNHGDIYQFLIPFDEEMIQKDSYTLSMTFQNEEHLYDDLQHFLNKYQLSDTNIQENTSLLMYKGLSDTRILTTILMVCSFLGAIILMGGVSLIYNAFSISLSERNRYLGMLSSVGATRRQKRQSVAFEAFIIGLIAIPIGLFSGIAGIAITFYCLNPIAKNVLDEAFELKPIINLWCVMLPIVFSILVLALSAWLPSYRASRISAITAIRQQKDINIRKRDVHTSKWVKVLFGIEADLGLKNTKRNHSRYLATLFSLIICIVLFMNVSYFSNSMKNSLGMVQNSVDADFIVDFYMNEYGVMPNEHLITQLKNVSAATSSRMFSEEQLMMSDQIHFTDEAMTYLEKQRKAMQLSQEDFKAYAYPRLTLQVMDDASFAEYGKEVGINQEDMKQDIPGIILVNTRTIRDQEVDQYSNIKLLSKKQGDTLSFQARKASLQTDQEPYELQDLSIVKTTDIVPPMNKGHADEIEIIAVTNMDNLVALNQQLSEKECDSVANFYEVQYLSKDSKALSKQVDQILQEHSETMVSSTMDISAQRQKDEQQYLFVSVFLYGFVILILLICTANIMNTISTSVSLRKREFAMIKSIGITPSKFRKMIMYETLFYGIKAILYGIPLGLLTTVIMNRMFSYSFVFVYDYPIFSILEIIIGVFVVLALTMSYAIHKIKNDNIVETIRKESI